MDRWNDHPMAPVSEESKRFQLFSFLIHDNRRNEMNIDLRGSVFEKYDAFYAIPCEEV